MKKRQSQNQMAGFRNTPNNQSRCTAVYHQMNDSFASSQMPPSLHGAGGTGSGPLNVHYNENFLQQHHEHLRHHLQQQQQQQQQQQHQQQQILTNHHQQQQHHQNQPNFHHHHIMTRHFLGQQQQNSQQQQITRHHVMNVSTNIPLNASECIPV